MNGEGSAGSRTMRVRSTCAQDRFSHCVSSHWRLSFFALSLFFPPSSLSPCFFVTERDDH